VSILGFVGDFVFPVFVLLNCCVTLHWLDCSKRIVEGHGQYCHVSSAIVAFVAIVAITLPTVSSIGTVLLNSYLDLSTRVCL
jgi:hypothetical protein